METVAKSTAPEGTSIVENISMTTHKSNFQDLATTAWSRVGTTFLPWSSNLMPWKWDDDTLQPYRKYTKLFGERKFAKSQPNLHLRFLDLPPEVRNEIYRQALTFKDGIDLAPKSTGIQGNGFAWKQRRKHYRYEILPRLKLLRTNKQVYEEAASIFYGENEFRFTNGKGWYVLSAFLRTIGQQNCGRLRSIAIHVPWYGEAEDNRFDGLEESQGTMSWMMRELDRMGLRHVRWARSFNLKASVTRCVRILESSGSLTSVRLLLPDSYRFRDYGAFNVRTQAAQVLDSSNFNNGLHVSLVRLHGGFYEQSVDQQVLDDRRSVCLESQESARTSARALGWKMEIVVYDQNGKYPAQIKDGDRVVEVDDEAEDD